MTTERNWLIRTTQNQILGPVAKAKVVEFLQKGALGLNDEVTSGNGFWFSLREKDLVEKYIYGDIPQGYNPISESKSVLAKRENPDKTTSLNTAPANKTQVLKAESAVPGVLPKNEDLEYPDITVVRSVSPVTSAHQEETKLPNQDDLEFPDITIVAKPASHSLHSAHGEIVAQATVSQPVAMKNQVEQKVEAQTEEGPIVYPQSDDLEFPDLTAPSSTPAQVEEELDFKVEIPQAPEVEKAEKAEKSEKPSAKKSGMVDLKNEIDADQTLTLMVDNSHHSTSKIESKEAKRSITPQRQPEKLLHERKVKSSAAPKEITKDLPKEVQPRVMPEHLKKRNDNYLLYLLAIIVLIILALFFYYYRNILNKPLPV